MAEAIAGLNHTVFPANVSIFGDRTDSGKFPKGGLCLEVFVRRLGMPNALNLCNASEAQSCDFLTSRKR
ncbi:hypothetical protein IQ267_25700 [filamentous cyanobacterium LEGE 07170]|nr:hypothetical protein [filamentous cyanobacterium LEGE 07170]